MHHETDLPCKAFAFVILIAIIIAIIRAVFKWVLNSNKRIVIATLCDRLKKSHASFSTNENQNQSHHVRVIFPALWAKLQVIGKNCDWFVSLFTPVAIGRNNYFGIGFFSLCRYNEQFCLLIYLYIFPMEGLSITS